MKKALLLVWLIFPFSGFTLVKGQDTLIYAKKEVLSLEPVQYNNETYTKLKAQKFYDYYRIKIKKASFLDSLYERFNRWLYRNLRKTMEQKEFNTMVWVTGMLIFAGIVIIILITKPGIFYFNRKNPLVYSIEEENMEVQDLDILTENSIQENRYSDAIRWLYLKTLKILHEQGYISYDAHKTVNEYAYEIKYAKLRKDFRSLSGEFIYYRYGKGEADAGKFALFRTAAETIQNMRSE
jgi:hypothetical protein